MAEITQYCVSSSRKTYLMPSDCQISPLSCKNQQLSQPRRPKGHSDHHYRLCESSSFLIHWDFPAFCCQHPLQCCTLRNLAPFHRTMKTQPQNVALQEPPSHLQTSSDMLHILHRTGSTAFSQHHSHRAGGFCPIKAGSWHVPGGPVARGRFVLWQTTRK